MGHYFSDFATTADVLDYKATHENARPMTVSADCTLQALSDFLADHHIGVALVSDDEGAVIGIVSERDLVRHIAMNGADGLEETTVEQVISGSLVTCQPDEALRSVALRMAENHVRHIVVTDVQGKCLGVVSSADIDFFAGEG